MSDDVVKVDRHWCLTEDRSRVVPETHPDARWLHWTPGQEVPRAEAERLGAIKPEPVMAAPTKQREAPANKARTKPVDKGA
jgi:hypothetical protein